MADLAVVHENEEVEFFVEPENKFVVEEVPPRRSTITKRTINKGHPEFELTYDMMLGIRTTVGRVEGQRGNIKGLGPADMVETSKLRFPRQGSSVTPAHDMESFKFKDYAPRVFQDIRAACGIDPMEYLLCVCGNFQYLEFISNSKSGQFFFYTYDRQYMIKTITHAEATFLLKILPYYHAYIRKNPNTYLTRFFGLHRVKPHKRDEVYFLIMRSVFFTQRTVHKTFDLKGSTQGRSAKRKDGTTSSVLKDLDLLADGTKIRLGPRRRDALLRQLRADVDFLAKRNIMDYSLLLGIHRRSQQCEVEGGSPPRQARSATSDSPIKAPLIANSTIFGAANGNSEGEKRTNLALPTSSTVTVSPLTSPTNTRPRTTSASTSPTSCGSSSSSASSSSSSSASSAACQNSSSTFASAQVSSDSTRSRSASAPMGSPRNETTTAPPAPTEKAVSKIVAARGVATRQIDEAEQQAVARLGLSKIPQSPWRPARESTSSASSASSSATCADAERESVELESHLDRRSSQLSATRSPGPSLSSIVMPSGTTSVVSRGQKVASYGLNGTDSVGGRKPGEEMRGSLGDGEVLSLSAYINSDRIIRHDLDPDQQSELQMRVRSESSLFQPQAPVATQYGCPARYNLRSTPMLENWNFVPPEVGQTEERRSFPHHHLERVGSLSAIRLPDGGLYGFVDEGEGEIYYLGIIDILTPYGVKKSLESGIKSIKYNKHSISAVPPDEYASRFLAFIDKAIV